jgi:hypothetical protein
MNNLQEELKTALEWDYNKIRQIIETTWKIPFEITKKDS